MKRLFKYLKSLSKKQRIFAAIGSVVILIADCTVIFLFSQKSENQLSFMPSLNLQNEPVAEESEKIDAEEITEEENAEEADPKSAADNKSPSTSSENVAKKEPSVSSPVYPSLPSPPQTPAGGCVIGYYMCWSRYKGYAPSSINAAKLTHINYAFANIGSDLSILLADNSVDKQNFADLRTLKSKNSNLRTLISVGGWDYSKYFSDAALTEESREIFAANCLSFILENGFDGIDIDWEYPVGGGMVDNISRAVDKTNYTLLIKKLREKLDEQKSRDGRNYCLTVTSGTGIWYFNKIEAAKIASYVDYIFVMAYDLNGPWDEYANFNAPLYSKKDIPAPGGDVSGGINSCLNAGVSASKLVLGVPFYGYKYNLVNTENNGIGCKFSGSSSVTFDLILADFLSKPDYQEFFDETTRVPYIFGNNTFISYDNEKSIAEKAQFAKSKGLGGVGAWELSFDKNSKLLSAMSNIIK